MGSVSDIKLISHFRHNETDQSDQNAQSSGYCIRSVGKYCHNLQFLVEELPLVHETLLPGSSTDLTPQQRTSATYNSCTYLPKVWSPPLERPPRSQCPVFPDVRLKKLPFYKVLQELLKPSSLMAQGTIRFQANMSMFHLTSEQLTDIARSCDFQLGSNIDKYHWLIHCQKDTVEACGDYPFG